MPTSTTPRFAFVTFLCNGTDHRGFGWADQMLRAHRLGLSLRSSRVERIAITHGYSTEITDMEPLTSAGWRVIDSDHIPEESFALRPIFKSEPRVHWPRHTIVQQRLDYNCTSLKLLAWNMTDYDRIMVSDTDVCVLEDPYPWMLQQYHNDEYFAAPPQGRASYQGLTSHFVFLQPDAMVFRMLRDMGTSRSFIPYTNSEQDIIETVFATRRSMPQLPDHRHDRYQLTCPRGHRYIFGETRNDLSAIVNATRRLQLRALYRNQSAEHHRRAAGAVVQRGTTGTHGPAGGRAALYAQQHQ